MDDMRRPLFPSTPAIVTTTAIVSLFALALLTARVLAKREPPPLTFNITATASRYDLAQRTRPPVLTLRLVNATSVPVGVSAYGPGNIQFVVTRNGRRVRAERTRPTFSESPRILAEAALTRLDPTEGVDIPFIISRSGSGVWVIEDYVVGRTSTTVRSFPLAEPGTYTVSARYKYKGADRATENVYHKSLRSNEVSFTLF